jgi:hypothetical protein
MNLLKVLLSRRAANFYVRTIVEKNLLPGCSAKNHNLRKIK